MPKEEKELVLAQKGSSDWFKYFYKSTSTRHYSWYCQICIYPSSVSFLEQCKNSHNPNANKSFNSVVWLLSPKETFSSLTEASLAIHLAVCLFNDRFEFNLRLALSAAGLSFTECSLQQWQNIDNERIENRDCVSWTITKLEKRT